MPTLSCSVLCLSAEAGTHAKLFWCFGGPERRALVPGMRRKTGVNFGEASGEASGERG